MHLQKLLLVSVMVLGVKAGLCATTPSVTYLSPSFDDKGHLVGLVPATCTKFALLDEAKYSGASLDLQAGWYVVSNAVGRVDVVDGLTVNGDVHLIVCNGMTLSSDQSSGALAGIDVVGKGSLTIYGQSPYTTNMGRVTALGGATHAGIEGGSGSCITINGGWIEATGGSGAAGIGGAQNQDGENILINGGYVDATSGQLGAGIGGGEHGNGRAITVNNGTVIATSGSGGQRIGGGNGGTSSDIVFAGGSIIPSAASAPVNAQGNPVYEVFVPDTYSGGKTCGKLIGACTVSFKDDFAYCAQNVYAFDDGHLFLYLPDGDYEISVLDEEPTVKRYRVHVQGQAGAVKRIYDYVTFESKDDFSLQTSNNAKNWDATLLWSIDLDTWNVWNGEAINAGYSGGTYYLYLRGTANTRLSAGDRWVLTSEKEDGKIACVGNLETLRGGAEDDPAPAPMDRRCFSYLFADCAALSATPSLPATNLADGCYAYMFQNCTALTEPTVLPAKQLTQQCYEGMFKGCSGILINRYRKGKVWMIPKDATSAAGWNTDMFADTGYFFMDDPGIGKEYYISLITLVNPASPQRYTSETDAENGVASAFVIWPNDDVKNAQPNPHTYNSYFWVTKHYDATTSEYVLDVCMTEATADAVTAALQAALPELVRHVTEQAPYTVVTAVPGIYYGIVGSTDLTEIALTPEVPTTTWTVGLDNPSGTVVTGVHPNWPSDIAFYRMRATIVP